MVSILGYYMNLDVNYVYHYIYYLQPHTILVNYLLTGEVLIS